MSGFQLEQVELYSDSGSNCEDEDEDVDEDFTTDRGIDVAPDALTGPRDAI